MKFDEMYPNAENGFYSPKLKDGLPGVAKLVCEDPSCESVHTCSCETPSNWVNITALTRVCSEECNAELWANLLKTFVIQQRSHI